MSGAAQRNDMAGTFDFPPAGSESTSPLKEVVAERLAGHRSRLAAAQAEQEGEAARQVAALHGERTAARNEARQGASRVRDAVAARYQSSVSYREFLAAEAERALQQAQAEAEVAARNARAVAEAQMQLLEELRGWKQAEHPGPGSAREEQRAEARGELAHALADIALGARELIAEPPNLILEAISAVRPAAMPAPRRAEKPASEIAAGGLTVRLYEEIGARERAKPADLRLSKDFRQPEAGEPEMNELEQEIEFRFSPEFEPHIIETTPIPANLIEFPRQLIAPRKARPRLAEGPLREEAVPEPQLRIFEVEAQNISIEAPASAEPTGVAEWQTLLLEGGAAPVPDAPATAQMHFTMQPQTAPLELRLMAAAVDGSCLVAAMLGFAVVVLEIAGPGLRALPRPLLLASAAGVLLLLFVVYQLLFFSLAEATPGMRYARIGLCTFSDTNPTRKAMRRRLGATLLAASPLAIGLAWAFLDEERLGWHDRMSRMYPRAY